ncbi:hypothetical protein Tco_0934855 [Tanacetum coccineum]
MVTTRRNSDDDVPNFEAMITAAVANALPNLTAALRTQITNDIRNGVGPSGGGVPLAFRSAATPAEAEDWITHMEKLFQVLGCPDNFKTRLAAFKLEIFYNRYFPASEQQRYERSLLHCIIELLHERVNSNKRMRDGIRIRTGDRAHTGEQGLDDQRSA